jgi:hypothetical protein
MGIQNRLKKPNYAISDKVGLMVGLLMMLGILIKTDPIKGFKCIWGSVVIFLLME